MCVQVPSDQTALTVENRSIRIGQGTRSLTEHIMEALQQSTPQIGIPDSFSSMVPPTLPNTSQRLRYSPPIMSFPNYGTSVSRSNSPSPVSFAGNNDISTSSSPSPSQHGTRKSSLPESPILGPVSSSERSAENGAMGFLKSVVLHSTAALNNFDLMPLGSLDQMKYDAVKKDSNIISPSVEEVRIHEAQNPVTTKVWDDEKLRALIKPKSVPKVVSEVTAYNLR
ncbi:unnamed protein product [Echinostoma caproni]|uniref:Pecanex-like protein n=1 Tax=Echinostoma caproni TaxID=27848 RepID=A0A183ACV3_9TREM|nr:unnamed protein product [Echinostoma caproni]